LHNVAIASYSLINNISNLLLVDGKLLWQKFTTVITLNRVFRQEGESEDQKRFRQLLTNIRDANPTEDDWKLLMTRTNLNLDPATRDEFDHNIHVFATNENVYNHNRYGFIFNTFNILNIEVLAIF